MKKIILLFTVLLSTITIASENIIENACPNKKSLEGIMKNSFFEILETMDKNDLNDLKQGLTYEGEEIKRKGLQAACETTFNTLGLQPQLNVKSGVFSINIDSKNFCLQYYHFMKYINSVENINKREELKVAYMTYTYRTPAVLYNQMQIITKKEGTDISKLARGYALADNLSNQIYGNYTGRKTPLHFVNLPYLSFSPYILKKDNYNLKLGSQDPTYSKYTVAILSSDFDTAINILLNESEYKDYINSFKTLCKDYGNEEQNIKKSVKGEAVVKDLLLQNQDLIGYVAKDDKCYNLTKKFNAGDKEEIIEKAFPDLNENSQATIFEDSVSRKNYLVINHNNQIIKIYENKETCDNLKNK